MAEVRSLFSGIKLANGKRRPDGTRPKLICGLLPHGSAVLPDHGYSPQIPILLPVPPAPTAKAAYITMDELGEEEEEPKEKLDDLDEEWESGYGAEPEEPEDLLAKLPEKLRSNQLLMDLLRQEIEERDARNKRWTLR